MNKVLKKVRSRNIKNNFKQFLSVIFIVLLATMLFSGFMTNSYTLRSCVDNYFTETNLADLWVNTDNVSAEDELFFEENSTKYDKRLQFETIAEIELLKKNSSASIYVYEGKVSTPYIETGKKGCLIDKNVAKDQKIQAGFHDISFSYVINYQGVDYTLDFVERLTGTMSLDERANTYNSWTIVIDKDLFLERVKEKLAEQVVGFDEASFEGVEYNQILLKTDNVEETSTKIKNYYESGATSSKLIYMHGREEVESVNLLREEVIQSQKMIYVFPIIFLVVAVLIILTTIDQLIVQEQKKIGILKACGVPNKKILKHYSFYGAILCTIGAGLGVFFGLVLIPEVMFSRYGMIYSIPEDYIKLQIPVWWLVALVLSMIVLGFIVALVRCYKILNKNPIDCLKYNLTASAKKLKKRKKKFKNMPISLKMAFRNIKMKPLRLVMGAVGMAGCVALLLSGFGIGDTLSKSLKNDLGNVFNYDISSTYSNADFKEKLANDSRIELFEDYSRVYASISTNEDSDKAYVYQVAENSKIFKEQLSGEDVCVSKTIADKFGLKVGDFIIISLQDKVVKLKISSTIETSFMSGVFVCKDLGFDEEFVSKGVWINTKKSADNEKVAEFVNEINGTNTALTIEEEKENVKSRIMSTSTMTKTIKVFGIMLAVIVLLNFIFLILKERVTEIATLKVIGQNSLQISIAVFIEVFVMAGIGMILGMIFGYPLMLLILAVNKVELLNYIVSIKFISFLATFFIILFTIFAVLFVCFMKIKKVNMAESLKSVE